MADVRYTSGAARHHHERAYFCLIRRGMYSESFGRRSRECRPGLLVFHPPGESHAQTLRTPTADVLNVELGPRWLSRMHEHGVPLDQPFESDDPELARMADLLLRHARRGGEPGLVVESLTAEILARVGGAAAPRDRPMPGWLRDVRDLVGAAPCEPPSLAAIASAVGIHPMYLAQTFRRFFGCSLGEYARRQRLERARRLIAAGQLPLAQIAADAGFADQSHFSRTFKRFMGVTPGHYRTFLAFKTGPRPGR